MLDHRLLRHFAAAARHGNLTDAAGELRISQPALSKSIKALEAALGVRLLERGRFGVAPTPFGERLLVRASAIESEIDAAEREIDAMKGVMRGELVIGCGPSEATRLLPQALALLRAEQPSLRVTVLYGLNEALMPMVRRGEIEFALSSVPQTASDPTLSHRTLHTDTAAVIARSGHPLAAKRRVEPSDLTGYAWVLARRRELERRALDELFLNAGLRPVAAAIETTSAVLMKSVLLETDTLSFLPREMIHWEERAGLLCALRLAAPRWERAVGITQRRSAQPSAGAAALAAALERAAAALAPAAAG